ncbi:MAG: DUF3786 domain-containing protein [Deltaproteobacteria bacterium]|nr:DUF3786 domain-containing protein [Deltaproteobacteria bacterium]
MSTGACGINCDVCRLNVLGICSTCGPGTGPEALQKLEAQKRIFGVPCPMLACARENHTAFCSRDCDRFPCPTFREGEYPFSQGYLNMQERRRNDGPPAKTPSGKDVSVPTSYWDDLENRDVAELCKNALAKDDSPHGLVLPFLDEFLFVDVQSRCIHRQIHGQWAPIDAPLLELLSLIYLLKAGPQGLIREMVSVNELKSAHFFRGPHELKIRPLLARYGNDPEGFKKAARDLGGETLDLADASCRLLPFPKAPFYYLFWKGDEEFQPVLSILFDRSIERHLPPDAIWGLVNLVSDILFLGDSGMDTICKGRAE